MQIADILAPNPADRQLPQRRHNVLLRPPAVGRHGVRLAAQLRVFLEIPRGKLRDRRSVRALRRKGFRDRLLARLDPRDDERRAPPRFLGEAVKRQPRRAASAGS